MAEDTPNSLQRSLKNRHIQMIALGGAIGTGLFYGSAVSIGLAGPSIILSYLIGGCIIFMIMHMMGEMSVEDPVSGAFSAFAYTYWGTFPGFLSGWNYWFLYIFVSMAELSVVGIYVNFWLPEFPQWLTALLILVVITLINLVNVKLFGELEFWFALIKVAAVIGMIVLGGLLIVSGFGGTHASLSNLWEHGGFFPHGIKGTLLSLVIIMFSFGGTELIGVTAGEADNPKKSIPKAIKQVLFRILLFYIGALTVMMILYPWNRVGLEGSPFVMIFSRLGISSAATILNIVVLTAAISVYNSGIYSNARMLFSLAQQGNAPKIFTRLSPRHVPYMATLFSSLCTLMIVVLNYLFPGKMFMYIMSVATIGAIITWSMIVLVHLRFRRFHQAREHTLDFKTPFFPYINYICLAFLALVVCMMTQLDDTRTAVYVLPVWLAVLYVGFRIKQMRDKKQASMRK